ncbi:hypothetical protein V6B14_22385 (plasmid) [Sporosarcina psychrophila]|uniref:hypothetical protein n=1 Tax=Sporosarcina psychrophila TaxID=1476 RepID=UPI0030D52728
MLNVTTALEVHAFGVFRDKKRAAVFNKGVGGILHLHRVRTTLDLKDFKTEFFKSDADGAYLEACCGIGNVELKVTNPPLFVVHGLAGSYMERKSIKKIFSGYKKEKDWNRMFYKDSTLLNIDEIEKFALSPFKIVLIRNFGEVNAENLEEFKGIYYESCSKQLPEYFRKSRNDKLCL